MPCPHLSRASGDCLLQQDPESETDEGREPVVTEAVSRDWCLGSRPQYRDCPLFRRFIAELVP
jgi:hypothetical protein